MIQRSIIQCASFSKDEILVSNILLNLKDLIEESESRSRVPLLKLSSSERRRYDRNFDFNSPSPNSVRRNSHVEEDEIDDVEFVKLISEKTNPETREELMGNIKKLTRFRESLIGEVMKVQRYYNNQKAYNLELKSMRDKVMTNLNRQEPETSHMLQYPMGHLPQAQPFSSSAYGLGSMNRTSPIGIPHHEFQYPMGHLPQTQPMVSSTIGLGFVSYNRDIAERKAQYGEARRKRTKIIEIKRSSVPKDR